MKKVSINILEIIRQKKIKEEKLLRAQICMAGHCQGGSNACIRN